MRGLHQIALITVMNLRALRGRITLSLVVVIGMALVVGVTLSLLSMSRGLMRTVEDTGEPDRIMILSHDAQGEGQSAIPRAAVQSILDLPGIRRDSAGAPLASADALTFVPSTKKEDSLLGFVQLRGVSGNFFGLHPEIHLTEGRMFTPALHEVIVGRQIAQQFADHTLGDDVSLPEGDWKIVGVFDTDTIWASAMLTDASTLMGAYRRSSFNSVTVRIERDAPAYAAFNDVVKGNPNISVDPQPEPAYYAKAYAQSGVFLKLLAYWVGGVMGLGAVFGALNTMYTAVSTRRLEIATLRAIGFGPAPVVVSIAVELIMLALIGAAIGATAAWVGFNGKAHMFGNLAFPMTVDGPVFAAGVILALVVGAIGALFPAIRAARLPVATALQVR